MVRSHPEFSGALVVDAIIYNRASFSQPFLLELRFADLNGHLIANRRFSPASTSAASWPDERKCHRRYRSTCRWTSSTWVRRR